MAEPPRPKRLALDTNVLMDLAAGEEFAKSFVEKYQARGYDLRVPPTALVELAYFAAHGDGKKQRLAEIALKSMWGWRITPIVISDIERKHRENFVTGGSGSGPAAVQGGARRIDSGGGECVRFQRASHVRRAAPGGQPRRNGDRLQRRGLSPVAIVHPARMAKALR